MTAIGAYNSGYANVYALCSPATPQQGQGAVAGQEQPGSANPAGAAAVSAVTPLQFSSTMMLDLLNFTQDGGVAGTPRLGSGLHELALHAPLRGATGNDPGFRSCTASSDEVPGGLDLGHVNASDAANEIVRTVGKGGKVSLADVDQMLGITSVGNRYSPGAAVARGWTALTGSPDASVSAAQLTSMIQSYLNAATKSAGAQTAMA